MKRISLLGFEFFVILAQSMAINIKQFNKPIMDIKIGPGRSQSYISKQTSPKQFKARKSAKRAENQARNKQH